MSLKTDVKMSFAVYVLNAGKDTPRNEHRRGMNPQLQKKTERKHRACNICLLNSGGGVTKAQTENKVYSYESRGV